MTPLLVAVLARAATAAPASDPGAAGDKGWAAIGAPLVSYDTNLLLGLGVFASVVIADDTGEQPFKASFAAQGFYTTGGFQDHYLRWDLPAVGGSRFRWDARLRYRAWSRAPYFGLGNDTPRQDEADVNATWYLWDSETLAGRTNLRHPLGPSPWEVYGTLVVQRQGVGLNPTSLLSGERPEGVDGGTMVTAGLGLFRDTRSNEIDPFDGTALDLQLRGSHPWLRSDWSWWGAHASWRGWWEALPRVVLASRLLVDSTFGGEPFFNQAYIGGLGRGTLGGRYFLRGLSEERLRGDGVAAVQGELRWSFVQFTAFRTLHQRWMLVPFFDLARIWTWDEAPGLGLDPHVTGGAGVRANFNELLILRIDAGYAVERYVDEPTRRGQLQYYILGEHPF